MEQLFINRDWFDFCQACGTTNPEYAEYTLCEACWQQSERDRATRLGIPFDKGASYDKVSDLLDRHLRICQYLSLTWNDCLSREKGQPTKTDGHWFPFTIKGVPAEEVEALAVEIIADDVTAATIYDTMFDLLRERSDNLKWETNPDQTRQLVGDYWPPVPRDDLYHRIATLLWNRWQHFLPFKVVV